MTLIRSRMHVFADIRPYICTFPSCRDVLNTFPTRQFWAEHEFSKHRIDVSWICPECQGEYHSTKALEHHLAESHGCVFTRSKFSMLVNTAHRSRQKPIKDQKCPLCIAAPGTTRRAFVSHLARHMEEIALLALPRETEDDSGHDAGDDARDDQGGNLASTFHNNATTSQMTQGDAILIDFLGGPTAPELQCIINNAR